MRWSYACYGKINSFVQMNCPWGSRVALKRVAFGSKPDSNCPPESGLSTPFGCCIPACGDCLVDDVGFRSGLVQQTACLGKTACSVRAQRAVVAGCANQRLSSYMVVIYDCVPEFGGNAVEPPNNRSMAEEVCAEPTFNRPNVVWPPPAVRTREEHPFPVPPGRFRSTPATIPAMRTTVGRVTENTTTSLDVAREGAIIGAVVGGVTLLVITALVAVICCCIRWKTEKDEDKEGAEKQSNLSFMDPLTLQPSYHAFGSVDGSSMADQVAADSVSVWSASTGRQQTTSPVQYSLSPCYINDLCNGFVPRKVPSSSPTDRNSKTQARSVGRRHIGSQKYGNKHGLRPQRLTKTSTPRNGKSKDRLHATYNHHHMSGRRLAKDEYYRSKGWALKKLGSRLYSTGESPSPLTDPPVDKHTLASWWLMGAMRTNSDPIKRFQQNGIKH